MSEIKILSSKNDVDAFIQKHQKCIIKFSAEWCAPCRRMADYYQDASTKYKDKIVFGMVDMTNGEELNAIYNIQYYPTFKAFSKQKEFGDVFGAKFQNLCDLIKSLNDLE
eukprot:TCONS_00067680-protein